MHARAPLADRHPMSPPPEATIERSGDPGRSFDGLSNRAVGALLAGPRLGSPTDAAERRADAAADAVMARLSGQAVAPPALGGRARDGVVRREGGEGAGAVDAGSASRLARAMEGGGQPLGGAARGPLERGFGRGVGDLTVHTGPEADALGQQFRARAFSVDDHLFFRRGEYAPHTARGRRLLAHEVAHALDGEPGVVRRTYRDATLGKFYSHALAGQEVDASNAVVTVVGQSSATMKGHAWVYLEYLGTDSKDVPCTDKVELTAGGGTLSGSGGSGPSKASVASSGESQQMSSGWSGSGSGSRSRIHITQAKATSKEENLLSTKSAKRSWVVGRDAIDKIKAKAKKIADSTADYTYKLFGRSMFALKKTINCARFAEKILKAGGIGVSAGWMMKTTSGLLDGRDVGHTVDADWERAEAARQAEILRQKQAAEARARRFEAVPEGKLRATWDPTATTLLAGPEAGTDPMVPYTLVDAFAGPGEIKKDATFVVTEHTKAQGIALLRGDAWHFDGTMSRQGHVDLDDLLRATTSLS